MKLDSVAARAGGARSIRRRAVLPRTADGHLRAHDGTRGRQRKAGSREFREVYVDLNSASIPESRVMITDGGADGLRAKRSPTSRSISQDAAGKSLRFTGNWREQKMSEQDYMKVFTQADEAYVAALQALLAELKKAVLISPAGHPSGLRV